MTENLNYMTPGFEVVEIELKGVKKCYVQGYISTIDADDYNEIVSMNAQGDILAACKGHVITMDVEHEEFIDNGKVLGKPKNSKIPVAKIIEAELRAKGVWVKAEINQDSDRFKNIWGSIKGGFLHSFSIAFAPLKAITKSINGVTHKVIESLNLINVTLTGSPVNTNATFAPVMKAALKNIKMVEENNNEPAPVVTEPVAVEPSVEPTAVEGTPVVEEEEKVVTANDLIDAATQLANDKTEFERRVAEWDKAHPAESPEPVSAVEVQDNVTAETINPMAQIKSNDLEIKQLKQENATLKARLATPILKSRINSRVDAIAQAKKEEMVGVKSPLEFI